MKKYIIVRTLLVVAILLAGCSSTTAKKSEESKPKAEFTQQEVVNPSSNNAPSEKEAESNEIDESLSLFEELFADGPVLAQSESGLWGYIDINGNWVIEPQYQDVLKRYNEYPFKWEETAECGRFVVGLAPAKDTSTGKWGYINSDGEWAIEPKFNIAREFTNAAQLAVVSDENDLFGYINTKGDYIAPPIYKEAYSFNDGMGLVRSVAEDNNDTGKTKSHDDFGEKIKPEERNGDLYGYLDESGAIVIEPQYTVASSFSSGRAFVTTHPLNTGDSNRNTKHVLLIDKANNVLGEFNSQERDYTAGSRQTWSGGLTMIQLDSEYSHALGDHVYTGIKKSIIDENFKTVLSGIDQDFAIDRIKYGESGFVTAIDMQTGLYGIMDYNGSWLVEPQYDGGYLYADDTFSAVSPTIAAAANDYIGVCKDGHSFFINSTGDTIIDFADKPFEITDYLGVCQSFICVCTKSNPKKYGLVDYDGNVLVDFLYDRLSLKTARKDEVYLDATLNGLVGIIDSAGNWMIEPKFKQID